MPENRLELQQTQKLSQNLQTVIRMLSMDLTDLSGHLQKAVEENPALEYNPPQKSVHDYAMQVRARHRAGRGETPIPEAAAPVDVMEDLQQQLRLSALDAATRRAAVQMLRQLTPQGYMTQPLEEFAAEMGVSMKTARKALEAVQALEPAGIGARTVEECLCLQLAQKPEADPLCYELIRAHLPDIGKGAFRPIAKETGASLNRVLACVEEIRRLSPAPCSLRTEAVQYIMPEFSVEIEANEKISIIFLNDYYPTIKPSESFQRLSSMLEGEELAFAKRALGSASRLIQALEMRQSTMEKVAQIIVREQHAFFLGKYSLLPLSIGDAAREIGVHETTIYRALQGKYLCCAQGVFPLSYFFQKEVSGGVSTARTKEMIREICCGTGRLSDREIAEALEQRGVQLSRRTVAKYRAQMKIDSSFRRSAEEKE